jgi:serine/threonine protein kinase
MGRTSYKTSTGVTLESGLVIRQQYELIEPIGEGGFAKVWSAKHLYGQHKVALKFIGESRHAFNLGVDEFKLLSSIYHTNIIRTFEMGEDEMTGEAYMSMELMTGKSFFEVIKSNEVIAPDRVLEWLRQCVLAVQYLASMRLVHKDIKPQNIMFDGSTAKLIDFNISMTTDHNQGTTCYKCPLVLTEQKWMPYADIWALALSFYELLTKEEVFADDTSFDVELNGKYDKVFPLETFSALVNIIKGHGQDVEIGDYLDLFKIPLERTMEERYIPQKILDGYSITNIREKFLIIAMAYADDPTIAVSKNVIIKKELTRRSLGAPTKEMTLYKNTFSALNRKNITENRGKNASVLTEEFLLSFNKYSGEN